MSIILAALLTIVAMGVVGGAANAHDVALVKALLADRLAHPWLNTAAQLLTRLGSATFLLPLTALGAAWLWWKGRSRPALFLLATVVSGRIAIELIKLAIARPRPEIAAYPVSVSSFSFPSGHAGNSMTTFLAIAVAMAPARHRALAFAAAIVASLAVGATRPVLGVHWPTDVLAGWAFGIAWVALCAKLFRSRGAGTGA